MLCCRPRPAAFAGALDGVETDALEIEEEIPVIVGPVHRRPPRHRWTAPGPPLDREMNRCGGHPGTGGLVARQPRQPVQRRPSTSQGGESHPAGIATPSRPTRIVRLMFAAAPL